MTLVAPLRVMAAEPTVTFITLGTAGGPLLRAKRSESANAVLVGSDIYLFDVGDGVLRQMAAAGLRPEHLKAVFISHHHIDHDGGLPIVVFNNLLVGGKAPLPVIGPPGTVAMVRSLSTTFAATAIASQSLGNVPVRPLDGSVAPQDLDPAMARPTVVYQDADIRVLAITNDHFHFPPGNPAVATTKSYSYRIEAGGRSIVYSGDTGPSPNLLTLSRGADMLVSEVIDLAALGRQLETLGLPAPAMAGVMAHMGSDHSTPETVGRLARDAGVKEVVLTHLVPGGDDDAGTSGYIAGIDKYFGGRVRVANDLDRF